MKQIDFSEIQPGDVVRVEWSQGGTSWQAQGPVRSVSMHCRRIYFDVGCVDVDDILLDELTVTLLDRPAQWEERTLDELRVGAWVRVNMTSGHVYDGRLRRIQCDVMGDTGYTLDDGNVRIAELLSRDIVKVEVRRP